MPEIQPSHEFFPTEDIENIAQEVGEFHKHPEHKDSQGKEVVKEILQKKYELEKSNTPTPQISNNKIPDYMENAGGKEKQVIEDLVDLTLSKGIKQGIKKAKASHNPFIIDAFHDVVVDKVYEALVKKGVIKE